MGHVPGETEPKPKPESAATVVSEAGQRTATPVAPNPVGTYFPHGDEDRSEPAEVCLMWLADSGALVLGVVTADCAEGDAHVVLILDGKQAEILTAHMAQAVSSGRDWQTSGSKVHRA